MRYSDSDPGFSLSEQDIQAYVDGVLDAGQSERVHHYLGSTPEEAHRVAFYHRLNARLQAGFPALDESGRDLDSDANPVRTWQRAAQARLRRQRLWRWGAACLAVMLLLGGLAWSVRPVELLTPLGVMALEDAASAGTGCLAGATACAVPRTALDLSRVGFHATQAARVPVDAILSAEQTIYRNQEGAPVVLLSMPNWRLTAQPDWQARRVGSLRVLSWTHDGSFYILVGQGNTRGLMKAADLATAGASGRPAGF
jgi:anti-sigma factor RsiW